MSGVPMGTVVTDTPPAGAGASASICTAALFASNWCGSGTGPWDEADLRPVKSLDGESFVATTGHDEDPA